MKTLIPAYCQVMKFGGALIWGDFENKQNYKLKCQCIDSIYYKHLQIMWGKQQISHAISQVAPHTTSE